MKTCPTTRRVTRLLDHDLLASILVRLEHDLHRDDPGHGAVTFGIVGTDAEGITLATRHLDVADPVEALIGFSAPPEWTVFGIVTRGRARPVLDELPTLRADTSATPASVRMAMVVERSGLVVSGLRAVDGPFVVHDDSGEIVGRIPDACRRVLGLGTPAPEVPVEEFFAHLWLDHVLAEAAERPGQLTWADAVDLHFGAGLVGLLVPPFDGDGVLTPDEALMVGHTLTGEQTSWRFVREQAAGMIEPSELFDPEAAAWMDDGMFSREMLGGFPPVDLMLEALEQVAPPPVPRGVARAMSGWGLV